KGGDAGCDHKTDKANTRSFVNGQNGGGVNCTSWTTRDATPISGDCPKCGARRIDSQLGLESTPEEYLAKMVAVFRQVWRVLRDDGTLWVNMGDSYASSGTSGNQRLDELGERLGCGGGHKHSTQLCGRAP